MTDRRKMKAINRKEDQSHPSKVDLFKVEFYVWAENEQYIKEKLDSLFTIPMIGNGKGIIGYKGTKAMDYINVEWEE